MKKILTFLCAVTLVLVLVGSASAVLISGTGDPLSNASLTGGTQIDFESQVKGIYTSLTIGNVTFTANDNHFQIDDTYQGYNQQGIYLDNGSYGNNGFDSLTMSFASSVDAVGFTWGMAESFASWSLSAYDATANLLETQILPSTGASSNGEYYGIAIAGISSAVLSWNGSYDWIAVDNVTTNAAAPVPEPSTILLMGIGLLGLVGYSRKRSKKS